MANLVKLTEQNFEQEVIKSDAPVLVDFWAEWCGPCRMIGPIVEELAEEYSNKLKVGKVDVDANGSVAQRYKILSIPTILFFKNGEVVSQIVGAAPKNDLIQHIEKTLADGK